MDEYREIKQIGHGAFGRALLVERIAEPFAGRLFVIKQINLLVMSEKARREAEQEVNVLKGLSHVNIIGYKHYFVQGDMLHIVLEYADGGDLSQRIKAAKDKATPFPESLVLFWFAQIASAMAYVHSQKILHRDLKTQNIFLTRDNIIKLGDFGIARVLSDTASLAETVIGTPYYMSPELCENNPYNYKSDVWALGCVLYELLTLNHAFDGANMCALVLKILRGKYPKVSEEYSEPLRNMVDRMLQSNPDDRPTVQEILDESIMQETLAEVAHTAAVTGERQLMMGLVEGTRAAGGDREGSTRSVGSAAGAGVTPRPAVTAGTPFASGTPVVHGRAPSFGDLTGMKTPGTDVDTGIRSRADSAPVVPLVFEDGAPAVTAPQSAPGGGGNPPFFPPRSHSVASRVPQPAAGPSSAWGTGDGSGGGGLHVNPRAPRGPPASALGDTIPTLRFSDSDDKSHSGDSDTSAHTSDSEETEEDPMMAPVRSRTAGSVPVSAPAPAPAPVSSKSARQSAGLAFLDKDPPRGRSQSEQPASGGVGFVMGAPPKPGARRDRSPGIRRPAVPRQAFAQTADLAELAVSPTASGAPLDLDGEDGDDEWVHSDPEAVDDVYHPASASAPPTTRADASEGAVPAGAVLNEMDLSERTLPQPYTHAVSLAPAPAPAQAPVAPPAAPAHIRAPSTASSTTSTPRAPIQLLHPTSGAPMSAAAVPPAPPSAAAVARVRGTSTSSRGSKGSRRTSNTPVPLFPPAASSPATSTPTSTSLAAAAIAAASTPGGASTPSTGHHITAEFSTTEFDNENSTSAESGAESEDGEQHRHHHHHRHHRHHHQRQAATATATAAAAGDAGSGQRLPGRMPPPLPRAGSYGPMTPHPEDYSEDDEAVHEEGIPEEDGMVVHYSSPEHPAMEVPEEDVDTTGDYSEGSWTGEDSYGEDVDDEVGEDMAEYPEPEHVYAAAAAMAAAATVRTPTHDAPIPPPPAVPPPPLPPHAAALSPASSTASPSRRQRTPGAAAPAPAPTATAPTPAPAPAPASAAPPSRPKPVPVRTAPTTNALKQLASPRHTAQAAPASPTTRSLLTNARTIRDYLTRNGSKRGTRAVWSTLSESLSSSGELAAASQNRSGRGSTAKKGSGKRPSARRTSIMSDASFGSPEPDGELWGEVGSPSAEPEVAAASTPQLSTPPSRLTRTGRKARTKAQPAVPSFASATSSSRARAASNSGRMKSPPPGSASPATRDQQARDLSKKMTSTASSLSSTLASTKRMEEKKAIEERVEARRREQARKKREFKQRKQQEKMELAATERAARQRLKAARNAKATIDIKALRRQSRQAAKDQTSPTMGNTQPITPPDGETLAAAAATAPAAPSSSTSPSTDTAKTPTSSLSSSYRRRLRRPKKDIPVEVLVPERFRGLMREGESSSSAAAAAAPERRPAAAAKGSGSASASASGSRPTPTSARLPPMLGAIGKRKSSRRGSFKRSARNIERSVTQLELAENLQSLIRPSDRAGSSHPAGGSSSKTTSSEQLHAKVDRLRQQCEEMLGDTDFRAVYTKLREADIDDEAVTDECLALVGPTKLAKVQFLLNAEERLSAAAVY